MKYKSNKHWYKPFWRNWLSWILPSAEEEHTYLFSLDEDAWYDEDYWGVNHTNKICGIQLGRKKHWNTVRIGWRPNDKGDYTLYVYFYAQGVRKIVKLANTKANQTVKVDMEMADLPIVEQFLDEKYDYEFVVNITCTVGSHVAKRTVMFKTPKPMFVYQHNPYFGGKRESFNKHTIKLTRQ